MKKVIIIGQCGREHAIANKLRGCCQLFYYGKHCNVGIDKYASLIGTSLGLELKLSADRKRILTLIKAFHIDMVIIGPEAPLKYGLVDFLEDNGVSTIGPRKQVAKIETSKGFTRQLLDKYGLGKYSPEYRIFKPKSTVYKKYLKLRKDYVIKADGLHGGKGVKVSGEHLHSFKEAVGYCKEIHKNGEQFLIEEKLVGEEFSFMSFSDGINLVHTIPVKDYKRAYDFDKGPNTGSMGSVTGPQNRLSFLTDDDVNLCKKINERVVKALYKETGQYYKGILYGGYMKTESGIKIIEFNARFGDPEVVNILALLRGNLMTVFNSIIDQTLDKVNISFEPLASVFKYAVPKGYPDNPVRNQPFKVGRLTNKCSYIFASVGSTNAHGLIELGSRTFGCFAKDLTVRNCAEQVNMVLDKMSGPLFYRKDIGMKMTYKQAGVDIEEGNKVVSKIQKHVESTFNKNVKSTFGDFAGLFKFNNSILVSSTDGVGTKSILTLKLYGPEIGFQMLGQDIVNHCVNDILIKGAEPLFFLDYFASSKIKSDHVEFFVKGLAKACKENGCVLIGGETAEMPDIYKTDAVDMAGTIIGHTTAEQLINGKRDIKEADMVVGLPSTGPHTNGYTLIRKLMERNKFSEDFMDNICNIHKSYKKEIVSLRKLMHIHGLSHLTGGGWIDNPPRTLPENLKIKWSKINFTPLFKEIQQVSMMSDKEMLHTFNCGYGMLIFMDPLDQRYLDQLKLDYTVVGRVVAK